MKSRFCLLLVALLSFTLAAHAQTSRGTVNGIVTDPNGAVVPNASVTLTNNDTNVTTTTTTNDEGFYRFDAVILGNYSVTIESSGFGRAVKTNLVVNAAQISAVDVQLALGGQETVVDVTADAGAQLQTEAPVRGGNISPRQITELPIASRNPALLALTLPGVSTNRGGFGIGTFSVNGARGRSNNFLLDGIENNDISVAGQGYQINNPDAAQEVNIQTSNFDAEFGRAGGAVVNTITKSGTNEFNGTLAYFLDSTRDDAITSSLSRLPEIRQRGRLFSGTQQIFSGTLGGPVFLPRFGEGGPAYISGRNRTFFFGSFQEERRQSTGTAQLNVPSAAGRAALQQVAGVSPNIANYLALTDGAVATTNFTNINVGTVRGVNVGNVQIGTFGRNFADTFRARQVLARIDHRIGENDQLTGRYVFGSNLDPEGGEIAFPGFEVASTNRTQNFLVNEVHTFSPTFTNDLRVGYGRIEFTFPIVGSNPLATTQPVISIQNLTPVGVDTALPQGRIANNYIIQDTATFIAGRHTFRFGADLLEQRSRQSAPFNGRGSLTYSNSNFQGQSFTGLANFAEDFGGGGTAARSFGSPVYYPNLFRQSYFVQDRWSATSSLTLTLGLRYENFGQPINVLATPAFTGLFNIDPVTLTGPFSQPNEVERDNNNFAPTVGINYAPSFTDGLLGTALGDKRTVLRAGYQITYDQFFNNIASNAASSSPNVINTNAIGNPQPTTAQPRGFSNLSTRFATQARPANPVGDNQTLVISNLRNPYYQRFSAGIQRQLPSNIVIDAAYVGTKGTRLFINEDFNPLVPTALQVIPAGFTGTPSGRLDGLQALRTIRTNGGSSIYHAGQLEVKRRFTNNLQFTGSYTYSKFIDNGSEIFAFGGVQNTAIAAVPSLFGGQQLERAVSSFDRTHRAVFTYLYELPFFRAQEGVLGRALGGFQIAGITTFESGVPFTVLNGVDADGFGGNNDRPDVNPNGRPGVRAIPATTTSPSVTGFVNPDVVIGTTSTGANILAPIDPNEARFIGVPSGSGRTGNLGRNTERSPGTQLFDLTVFKRTRITEGTLLEFRTEFFNIFNRPNFGQGSVSEFTPGGGTIPGTVFVSQPGEFLNPNTRLTDGGGRTVRYQLKFIF